MKGLFAPAGSGELGGRAGPRGPSGRKAGGAGDPKMMAGGISEALVTTMLGLMVAAPLVLLHAFLASTRRRILRVLNEHSAGGG